MPIKMYINTVVPVAVLDKVTLPDILGEYKCAGNVYSVYIIEFV
jgi:hypothetical protein